MNKELITNSCFQHSARHITTWSQNKINLVTNKMVTIFNQIDYIIVNERNRQILRDARSYSGTETTSDHRLVVTRIDLVWKRAFSKKQIKKAETNSTSLD